MIASRSKNNDMRNEQRTACNSICSRQHDARTSLMRKTPTWVCMCLSVSFAHFHSACTHRRPFSIVWTRPNANEIRTKSTKIYLAAAPDKMDLSFSMRVHRASETKQQREKPVDAAFLLLCAVRWMLYGVFFSCNSFMNITQTSLRWFFVWKKSKIYELSHSLTLSPLFRLPLIRITFTSFTIMWRSTRAYTHTHTNKSNFSYFKDDYTFVYRRLRLAQRRLMTPPPSPPSSVLCKLFSSKTVCAQTKLNGFFVVVLILLQPFLVRNESIPLLPYIHRFEEYNNSCSQSDDLRLHNCSQLRSKDVTIIASL